MQNAASRFGLIAFLCLAIFSGAVAEQSREQCPEHGEANAERCHPAPTQSWVAPITRQSPKPAIIAENYTPNPSIYQYKCYDPPSREDADACQQRRSAQAAEDQWWISLWGLIASVFAAFFTGWAAFAAATAANAAKEATREARVSNEIGRLSRRAWVKIELTPYREIQFLKQGGIYSQITLSATNIGENVANDVRIFVKVFMDDNSYQRGQKEALAWLLNRLSVRDQEEFGRTILPNETCSFEPDLIVRIDEADVPARLILGGFILRVAAVAEYTTEPIAERRRTISYFDICSSDAKGGSQVLIPTDGSIPKEQLRVTKSVGGEAT